MITFQPEPPPTTPIASGSARGSSGRTSRMDNRMDVDPIPVVVEVDPEDGRRHASGTSVWAHCSLSDRFD